MGQNGTKSLKVWGFGKKVDKAIEQAKKNAVHACLFRGYPGSGTARTTPPIFNNQGKGQVAIDVQVMYDNLREKMEADGILKKASNGFSY